MAVFGMERKLATIMLFGAVVTVPLGLILITFFGAMGAAITSDLQMVITIAAIIVTLKMRNIRVWRRVNRPERPMPTRTVSPMEKSEDRQFQSIR